jgi:hypothetical protein
MTDSPILRWTYPTVATRRWQRRASMKGVTDVGGGEPISTSAERGDIQIRTGCSPNATSIVWWRDERQGAAL